MPTESQIAAFVSAVKTGDSAAVRALLASDPELRANIDGPYFNFDSPAILAASNQRNVEMIGALLENGADINARSQWWAGGFGVLPVSHSENNEWANYLISKGAKVDVFAAAGHDLLEDLEKLVESDPSLVNARGGDGQTPLHFARSVETCRFLLDRGAQIETRDIDHGSTPAQYAVNRPDKLRFLIEQGAATDAFMAVALGDLRLLETIINADPTVLSSTTSNGPHNPESAPGGHIYIYLIDNNASLLNAAAKFNQSAAIKFLVDRGLNVDTRGGYDDSTPLHLAAWCSSLHAINALLESGADINALSGNLHHNTPCGWAIAAGNPDAVRLLLDHGAGLKDWFLRNAEEGERGEFSFTVHKRSEMSQIIAILKEHGAT